MAECIAERRLLSMTDALATVDGLSIVDNKIMAEIELLDEARYNSLFLAHSVDFLNRPYQTSLNSTQWATAKWKMGS